MRFCQLYAKLGMKDEGLTRYIYIFSITFSYTCPFVYFKQNRYCHYLRKTCSSNAERVLKQYLYGSGIFQIVRWVGRKEWWMVDGGWWR